MMLLVDTIDEHPGPLNYDLMRCGARLRDWPDNGVTWGDLVDLVENAQPDTATYKALNPRWQQDVKTELLRSSEVTLRALLWAKTEDARKRRNYPEPWQWPWDEAAEDDTDVPIEQRRSRTRGESMTIDEARDWLGWETQMRND